MRRAEFAIRVGFCLYLDPAGIPSSCDKLAIPARSAHEAMADTLDSQAAAFAQLVKLSGDPDAAFRRAVALATGLFPHQIEGVAFLLGRRRAILADDMGLGKTRQAIVSLRHLTPGGPLAGRLSRLGQAKLGARDRRRRTRRFCPGHRRNDTGLAGRRMDRDQLRHPGDSTSTTSCACRGRRWCSTKRTT